MRGGPWRSLPGEWVQEAGGAVQAVMLEGEDTLRGWEGLHRAVCIWGTFPGSQVQLEGPCLQLRACGGLGRVQGGSRHGTGACCQAGLASHDMVAQNRDNGEAGTGL